MEAATPPLAAFFVETGLFTPHTDVYLIPPLRVNHIVWGCTDILSIRIGRYGILTS